MKPKIYSYNGDTTVNDGTNFNSKIVDGLFPPSSQAQYIPRAGGQEPALSGNVTEPRKLTVRFTSLLGASGLQTLSALIDTQDSTARTLVIKDGDDSDRQWYMYVKPEEYRDPQGKTFEVVFACQNTYWLTVASSTDDSWAITSSGDQYTINIDVGTLDAWPIYKITPGTTRAGANYSCIAYVYTRNYTDRSAVNWRLDLADARAGSGGFDTRETGPNIKDTTRWCLANGAKSSTDLSIDYDDVTGTLPASGILYNANTGEQIAFSSKTGSSFTVPSSGCVSADGTGRGIGGTTAAAIGDDDELYISKFLIDCTDVRIFAAPGSGQPVEIPRTIAPLDSQRSRIWIEQDYSPRAICSPKADMTDSQVSVGVTGIVNPNSFLAEDGLLLIDNGVNIEIVSYETFLLDTNNTTGAFYGLERGIMGSSAYAHGTGAYLYAIPNITIKCGKYDATAIPTTSDWTQAVPMHTTNTSTNPSRVYTSMWSDTYGENNQFIPSQAGEDNYFTAHDDWQNSTPADPAADIGVSAKYNKEFGRWQIYMPFGITEATFSSVEVRNHFVSATGWVGLANNMLPASWTRTAFGTSTAGTFNTWEAKGDKTVTPPAARRYARMQMQNGTGSQLIGKASAQCSGVTLTLSTATTSTEHGIPYVSMTALEPITYDMDAILENTTTGENLELVGQMDTGETLTINTLLKTIRYSKTGGSAFSFLRRKSSIRDTWLRCQPGNNTLKWTETGVTDVSVVVEWQARSY